MDILISLLWVVFYVVIAVLIVLIIIYGAAALGFPLPDPIQKCLWALVGIWAIILLVGLLFGVMRIASVGPMRPYPSAPSSIIR